ncbi:putative two-component system response regulator [Sedimentibacter acidaminivorans]|uniref:Two-component system response regulator n=1 Tax=Sedimentibacter acidaminivorans TaxID=913099 RepID=A0ABS4G983_9FIRM|nr:putative two-component system response regulator [Sedimentibacter acidaminivorans]
MGDVKPIYSIADDALSIDKLINENALRENCKICLKLENKEELISFFRTSLVNQRCLYCRFKRYEIKTHAHIIKSINYSIFLSKIKNCLSFKQANGFFEKNDFDVMELSKHIKEISVIHEIFYIAMDVLAEINNRETINHMKRTMLYVKELVELLSESEEYNKILTKEVVDLIVASALIHDIGKIGIPQYILMKTEKLTKQEFDIIKNHTILGLETIVWAENCVEEIKPFLSYAKEMVCFHHERWDGSGYPYGTSGNNIPVSARIMAVADAYDALTSERVYKEVIEHEAAVKIILENSGTHFDPDIVIAFEKLQHTFKEISKKHI